MFLKFPNFRTLFPKFPPFFKQNPILGNKAQDFSDFCLALELMKLKAHLTKEGIEKIRKFKEGMNSKRK